MNEREGSGKRSFFYRWNMFDVGDIVAINTVEVVNGYPYARNSIGGLFPVNRDYYEVVADLGNGIYIIGIGNIAIAAVGYSLISMADVDAAWEEIVISGRVRIKEGARNYMGYPLPAYVFGQEYTVANIMYDRVVLSNATQTLAVKGEDIV